MSVTIYALTDPRDGAVRYVGKANNPAKRLAGHLRDARRRRTPVYAWINKLVHEGLKPGLTVLAECCEATWKDQERRLIAEHRGCGRLLNVADGGDEPQCSIETRRENAKRFNADEGMVAYRELMRAACASHRFLATCPHKTETFKQLGETIERFRGFTAVRKRAAGLQWLARRGR